MTHSGRYYGAIVFLGDPEQALDRFTRIATATLEDYGHAVERQSILDQHRARIIASRYLIKLTLVGAAEEMHEQALNRDSLHRFEIELCPVAFELDDKDISELMLVVMLYRMLDIYEARMVEWLDRDTALTPEQFLSAFANVSPRRVRGRQEVLAARDVPFHPVDETEPGLTNRFESFAKAADYGDYGVMDLTDEESLSMAYRFCSGPEVIDMPAPQEQAASDIQRLATWGLTGMVGFLSAPVALSMVAVNLINGEDFRLNTNVLSLTGLLVMLQSTGALASAVSYLPL